MPSFSISNLIAKLTAGLSGFWGTLASLFLDYLFSYLKKKSIYVINVGSSEIQTNMERDQWEAFAQTAWQDKEQIDEGKLTLTPEAKKAKSLAFRKAFRNFATYNRVRKP